MKVSVAKIRAVQELSDNGKFKVFAIDHRDVFSQMVKDAGRYTGEPSVVDEKLRIIGSVSKNVSGYLLDPFYALPECIIEEKLPSSVGFMVNIENSDYRVESFVTNSCIENFSPRKIKKLGASAVKMFLYYNPESEYAEGAEKSIEKVAVECKKCGIPFLIEPVLYPCGKEGISPEDREELTYETVRRLSKLPIDIFKIDFPGNVDVFSEKRNIEICKKISNMLDVPWVIMSSGVDNETFEKQLYCACKGGASGYVVGRAVWKDYVLCPDGERDANMKAMNDRLRSFNKIVDKYAHPWTEKLIPSRHNKINWYTKI